VVMRTFFPQSPIHTSRAMPAPSCRMPPSGASQCAGEQCMRKNWIVAKPAPRPLSGGSSRSARARLGAGACRGAVVIRCAGREALPVLRRTNPTGGREVSLLRGVARPEHAPSVVWLGPRRAHRADHSRGHSPAERPRVGRHSTATQALVDARHPERSTWCGSHHARRIGCASRQRRVQSAAAPRTSHAAAVRRARPVSWTRAPSRCTWGLRPRWL
jgi:hypothetical protein